VDAYYAKLEPLWARLLEERKADRNKIMAKLKDKMDADKKKLTTILEAKIEDNIEKFEIPRDTLVSRRVAYQEATKACLGKTQVRTETGQEQRNTEIETELEEVEAKDLEANPGEMKAIKNADREEIRTNQEKMDANMKTMQDKLDADREKRKVDMKAFNEMMERR
jgi:hypothetical protein